MALPNARIDQLPPNGTYTGADLLVIWNFITGRTESVKITDLIGTPEDDQDFEWVTPHAYLTGEVVTRGGNWYQALVDNDGVTPGTDPLTWELITKSPSSILSIYIAGAYTQADVFVLSEHKGYWDIYKLVDVTRPFVSADIAAEELNEQWESIISPRVRKLETPAAGDLNFDFVNDREKIFYCTINEANDWAFINDARSVACKIIANFTSVDGQTLPGSWLSDDIRIDGDVFTPLFVGKYIIEMVNDGTNWIVQKISDNPFN